MHQYKNFPFGAGIKFPVGPAEDQNLNESCIRKVTKCLHVNLMLGAKGLTHDFKLKGNLSCTLYCYGEVSLCLISFI